MNYCAFIIYSFLLNVKRPDVCQAEITNMNVRGGRMKRKMQSFAQQTSLDGEFMCQSSKISFLVYLLSTHFNEYVVWVLRVKIVFCSTLIMSTASQQALRHGLSLEVDRLGELINKLENKVSH